MSIKDKIRLKIEIWDKIPLAKNTVKAAIEEKFLETNKDPTRQTLTKQFQHIC